jgi:MFS family permease
MRVSQILKGNLIVLIISASIWNLAESLASPYFSLYILALGGTYFDIGLTNAISSLFMLIPLFLAGPLTDVIGRKKLVVYLGFLITPIFIIFSQAPSWELLLLGRTLHYFIMGFRGPAFSSILADSTKPKDRAFSLALWQRIPQAITLASPFIGGYIIDEIGIIEAMRLFYLITFFACLAAQVIRFWYLEETLPNVNKDVVEQVKSAFREIKEIPSKISKQTLFIIGIRSVLSLAVSVPASYWVIYATRVAGLTASEWGLTTIVHNLTMIIFSIIFALAADRFGRSKFIIASLLLSPLALAFFSFGNNFSDILLSRTGYSLFVSLRSATLPAIFIDYSPRTFRGRLNAFQRLASRPMAVFGSLVGGYLYQNTSYSSPFFVGAAIMVSCGLSFLALIKEPKKYEE